ncbi:protein mono-ADP-ribosyltransferase PARP14-like [Mya arenaria]|uniref:protein mono-ADP-ribosyltransferase PARP14-like n=1 Tax=Mya arenaria TaxID=6604 RepID=UPI0022E759BA|nr:protein mono-ADP-ribosyltransferase PARP14-like [Mya arenaria]
MSELQAEQEHSRGDSFSLRKCTLCEEDDAMFKCCVCVNMLCEECCTAHRRQKDTKTHKVVAMSASENNQVHMQINLNGDCSNSKCCSTIGHENQTIEGYCYLCNLLLCRECISANHENHDYASLSDAFDKQVKTVESYLNKLQQHSPANLIQKCDKAMQDCKENSQLLANSVQEHFKQYSNAIKEHLTLQMDTINSSTRNELQQLQETKAFMQLFSELESLKAKNIKTEFIIKSIDALKKGEQLDPQFPTKINKRNLRCVACSTNDFNDILRMIASVGEYNGDEVGEAHTSLVCLDSTPFLEAVRSLTMTATGKGSSLPCKNNSMPEGAHSITARKLCDGNSMPNMNLIPSDVSQVKRDPELIESQQLNDLSGKPELLTMQNKASTKCIPQAIREAAVSSAISNLAGMRLKSRGLDAHWQTDEDCILVHSDTQSNAERSLNVIIGSIEQAKIPVRNECRSVMMSDKWYCRKSYIETHYPKMAWISYSEATNEIVVCATCSSILRDVCSDVRKFLQDHVLKVITLQYPESFAPSIMKHKQRIRRIETELSQSAFSLTFNDQTIIIQGFGFATTLALRKLKSLAQKIGMKQVDGEDRFDSSDEDLDSDTDDTRFEDTDSLKKKTNIRPKCNLVVAGDEVGVGAVCCPGGDVTIYAVRGDITQLPVFSVVNPADPKLKHNGGLAKILVQKGGPCIQTECTAFVNTLPQKELTPGSSFCSTAGCLSFSAIIHAVTCRWDKHPEKSARKLLFDAVTSALHKADDKMISSIAIPAIGAGTYKYPVDISTETIVEAVKKFLTTNPHSGVRELYLCDMATDSCMQFVRALETHFNESEIILSNPEYAYTGTIQHEHDGSLPNDTEHRDLHGHLTSTSEYAASKIFLL